MKGWFKNMNQITIIGRLASAPEVKKSNSGTSYVQVSVAVPRESKKDSAVDWIPCAFVNKAAEIIGMYTDKGSRIVINGRLQSRSYEDEGKKRTSYTVLVNDFTIIDFKEAEKKEDNTSNDIPFEV